MCVFGRMSLFRYVLWHRPTISSSLCCLYWTEFCRSIAQAYLLVCSCVAQQLSCILVKQNWFQTKCITCFLCWWAGGNGLLPFQVSIPLGVWPCGKTMSRVVKLKSISASISVITPSISVNSSWLITKISEFEKPKLEIRNCVFVKKKKKKKSDFILRWVTAVLCLFVV